MAILNLTSKHYLEQYDEMLDYLQQDDGYWLKSDKWSMPERFTYDIQKMRGKKYLDFSEFSNERIKVEVKYYYAYSLKEQRVEVSTVISKAQAVINKLLLFLNNRCHKSVIEIDPDKLSLYLLNKGLTIKTAKSYSSQMNEIIHLISEIYDTREETDKDIWYAKNINGAIVSVLTDRCSKRLDFNGIPSYYREMVKRYFRTIITKRSFKHCRSMLLTIQEFFTSFYQMGYSNDFLKELSREDIEKYMYKIFNKHKERNITYVNKFISYPRTFLEYIQMAQYLGAPEKEVSFLIFQDDIPKRERDSDRLNRVMFVPAPIMEQIDAHIGSLGRPEFIPIYILLRETGWRGTDILNLRYKNCLEKIWNSKEDVYNYYLCGEITKTGIALLKIPIRPKAAEMLKEIIDKAKELSTEINNPNGYLFNTYTGKRKGEVLCKATIRASIQSMINHKEIRDGNNEFYHFRFHSLRHTRAKEYVEQGMGISIIQQILGHQSLQMTVHYATVTENTLYEKWKATAELGLFKINANNVIQKEIQASDEIKENIIRYEYVKQNLDAVKVPFGMCFKTSKISCRQQMNHCLACASFCTTIENIPEYETEIACVKDQIEVSETFYRDSWIEKNKLYLATLETMVLRLKVEKIIHKNGISREEV